MFNMKLLKIFISSVQKEFELERKALVRYIRNDALLGSFFEVFLFEEIAASGKKTFQVYLTELTVANIYIGLLGNEYGFEDSLGISPTEHEYNEAKRNHLQKWIYIKGYNDENRHPKELKFIQMVGVDVSRKRFETMEDLKTEVYKSCVRYLKQTGKIMSHEFDETLNNYASLDDLDSILIQQFVINARAKRNFPLRETAKIEQILIHLGLLRNHQLTNSAILAFGKNPQHFFVTATVKCTHFHGIDLEKPIPDYKEFGGTIFEMTERSVDFVLSKISLSTGTRVLSNKVDTNYEIPRRVIAEAIINAIAHRDYSSKGSIQISVFKNRVEIFNPGRLHDELELTDLLNIHGSYPNNPTLANCMFLTGDIERYGTGIIEMIRLSKEADLITPEFIINEGFKVILWRPSVKITEIHDAIHDAIHDTMHDFDFMAIENRSHRVVWLLKCEMSRDELMAALKLKNRDNFQKTYLKPALKNNLIELTLPEKKTSKKQKYKLTKTGTLLHKKLIGEGK